MPRRRGHRVTYDILVLSHLVPYPTTSGVLLRCYNLLREVAKRHRVHLYCVNQTVLLGEDELAASVEHLRSFCHDVQVFPLPSAGSKLKFGTLLLRNLMSPLPYSFDRFYSPPLEHAVIALLAKTPIHLVQYETIAMAPYGQLAPDLPQILVHQNVESRLLARRAAALRDPLKRWYVGYQAKKLAAAELGALKRLDAHVAVSDDDRLTFLGMRAGAPVHTVVNGVDVDYFRPGPTPAGTRSELVFVGGMSWYPNADGIAWFLQEIWPRIIAEVPNCRLTLVGSHPSAAARRAAAGDPERVQVTGLVPDVRPLVDPAALFVCPFRVGGGTRLKVLDAWSMQKAILSTSIGCEGLEARHDHDLWIADTPDEFAASAVKLLADPETRQRLGVRGRARVEQEFAWPQVAQGMLGLYDALVSGYRGQSHAGGATAEVEA